MKTRCPKCGKLFNVAHEQLGRRASCRCGEVFRIVEFSETPPAAEAPIASPSPTRSAAPPKSGSGPWPEWAKKIIGVALLLGGVAIFVACHDGNPFGRLKSFWGEILAVATMFTLWGLGLDLLGAWRRSRDKESQQDNDAAERRRWGAIISFCVVFALIAMRAWSHSVEREIMEALPTAQELREADERLQQSRAEFVEGLGQNANTGPKKAPERKEPMRPISPKNVKEQPKQLHEIPEHGLRVELPSGWERIEALSGNTILKLTPSGARAKEARIMIATFVIPGNAVDVFARMSRDDQIAGVEKGSLLGEKVRAIDVGRWQIDDVDAFWSKSHRDLPVRGSTYEYTYEFVRKYRSVPKAFTIRLTSYGDERWFETNCATFEEFVQSIRFDERAAAARAKEKASLSPNWRNVEAAAAADPNLFASGLAGVAVRKPAEWRFVQNEEISNVRRNMALDRKELDDMVENVQLPVVSIMKYPDTYLGVNPTVQIGVRPKKRYPETNPSDLLGLAIDGMKASEILPDFAVIEEIQPTQIDHIPAATASFRFTLRLESGGAFSVLSRLYYAVNSENVIIVGMSGPDAGPDKCDDEFASILQSLRLAK